MLCLWGVYVFDLNHCSQSLIKVSFGVSGGRLVWGGGLHHQCPKIHLFGFVVPLLFLSFFFAHFIKHVIQFRLFCIEKQQQHILCRYLNVVRKHNYYFALNISFVTIFGLEISTWALKWNMSFATLYHQPAYVWVVCLPQLGHSALSDRWGYPWRDGCGRL